MEIKEFIMIEDEGEYIHISGQFVVGTKKGKDINKIVGIAVADSDNSKVRIKIQ